MSQPEDLLAWFTELHTDMEVCVLLRTKTIILAVVVLAVAAGAVAAVWLVARDTPVEGEKAVFLQVIADGGTVWSDTVHTDALYLRGLLEEAGLVTADESEFLSTVNGRTADSGKQEWWSLTKDGEMLMTGASEAVIEDGDRFEVTLMVGFDFDW
jgi:hypothetical protein